MADKNKDEVAIQNVSVDDFIILLEYLYPSQNQGGITVGNVESLLKMADFFGIDDALIKIGSFLEACDISEDMTLGKKLLFAERYHLKTLEDACVEKFYSGGKYVELQGQEEYNHLSDRIKVKIMEKSIWHSRDHGNSF